MSLTIEVEEIAHGQHGRVILVVREYGQENLLIGLDIKEESDDEIKIVVSQLGEKKFVVETYKKLPKEYRSE